MYMTSTIHKILVHHMHTCICSSLISELHCKVYTSSLKTHLQMEKKWLGILQLLRLLILPFQLPRTNLNLSDVQAKLSNSLFRLKCNLQSVNNVIQ